VRAGGGVSCGVSSICQVLRLPARGRAVSNSGKPHEYKCSSLLSGALRVPSRACKMASWPLTVQRPTNWTTPQNASVYHAPEMVYGGRTKKRRKDEKTKPLESAVGRAERKSAQPYLDRCCVVPSFHCGPCSPQSHFALEN